MIDGLLVREECGAGLPQPGVILGRVGQAQGPFDIKGDPKTGQ